MTPPWHTASGHPAHEPLTSENHSPLPPGHPREPVGPMAGQPESAPGMRSRIGYGTSPYA